MTLISIWHLSYLCAPHIIYSCSFWFFSYLSFSFSFIFVYCVVENSQATYLQVLASQTGILYLNFHSKWILQHLYRIADVIIFSHLDFIMVAHSFLYLGFIRGFKNRNSQRTRKETSSRFLPILDLFL